MNFLKYIELSAENLQFFLWYRDYVKRFNALPESERVLSPEWTGEKNSDTKNGPANFNADAAAILKGTDFANEGKVVSREQLMREIWETAWFGSTKTLDMHISVLRRKLGDDATQPRYISTVRGVGFRFERSED